MSEYDMSMIPLGGGTITIQCGCGCGAIIVTEAKVNFKPGHKVMMR